MCGGGAWVRGLVCYVWLSNFVVDLGVWLWMVAGGVGCVALCWFGRGSFLG